MNIPKFGITSSEALELIVELEKQRRTQQRKAQRTSRALRIAQGKMHDPQNLHPRAYVVSILAIYGYSRAERIEHMNSDTWYILPDETDLSFLR
jgi:hypothetical protein